MLYSTIKRIICGRFADTNKEDVAVYELKTLYL